MECRYTFQSTVHSNKTWLNFKSFEELPGRRTKLWDSVWTSNNPSRGSDNFVCQFSFNFPYYAELYEFESLTYLFLCKLHSHPNRVFQLNGLYSSNFMKNYCWSFMLAIWPGRRRVYKHLTWLRKFRNRPKKHILTFYRILQKQKVTFVFINLFNEDVSKHKQKLTIVNTCKIDIFYHF